MSTSGKDDVLRNSGCQFGSVRSKTLLACDSQSKKVTDGRISFRKATTDVDCCLCHHQQTCCCCGRKLNVVASRSTVGSVANQEEEYNAWACWHCFSIGAVESTTVGTALKKGDPKCVTEAAGHLLTTVATSSHSPRPVTHNSVNSCHVNRTPGGNWWGSRGPSGVNSAVQSLEFSHYRQDDEDDNLGQEVTVEDLSTYAAAVYRVRCTVQNVGSARLGDRTLGDLDPSEDPYMRKFRTCGIDVLNRLQQLMPDTDENRDSATHLIPQNSPTFEWCSQVQTTSAPFVGMKTAPVNGTIIHQTLQSFNMPTRTMSAATVAYNSTSPPGLIEFGGASILRPGIVFPTAKSASASITNSSKRLSAPIMASSTARQYPRSNVNDHRNRDNTVSVSSPLSTGEQLYGNLWRTMSAHLPAKDRNKINGKRPLVIGSCNLTSTLTMATPNSSSLIKR